MRRIGKYEILALLGRGGMGRVYKARLPVAGRIVALKLLAPDETLTDLLGQEALDRAFCAEAALLGGLRHPRVAQVLDFDRDAAGRPFYCLEFFCQNLGLILRESYRAEEPSRPLPVPFAVRLGAEVLDGVGRLHEAGILHRDLKPFNVMLDDEDRARLIDFGLSARRGEGRAGHGGLAVGTPFYTAPEQEADAARADERSDLYSVGVMLWRMLTGRLPAEDPARRQRPSALEPGLLGAFDDVLARAVDPDPARRYQDAGSMERALAEALANWEAALPGACVLREEELAARPAAVMARPRGEPRTVRPMEALAVFPLDASWRPLSGGQTFEPLPGGVVRDPATGLCWQRLGSPHPLDWPGAHDYCARLASGRFAGRMGWRLPTIDELCTIVARAEGADGYCLDPVFDRGQGRLWSADRASRRSAWCADARLGSIGRQDTDCLLHVRAVCPFNETAKETT